MVPLIVSCIIEGIPGTGYKPVEFEEVFDAFKLFLKKRVNTSLDRSQRSSDLVAIYGQILYGIEEPKRGVVNGMKVQRYSEKHRDIQVYLYIKPEEFDCLSLRAKTELLRNRFELLLDAAAKKVPPISRPEVELVLENLRA